MSEYSKQIMKNVHKSVLLQETLNELALKPEDVVIDATLGGGGHAQAMARALGEKGILVAIDKDSDALARVRESLKDIKPKIYLVKDNFRNIKQIYATLGLKKANKILFDLGLSTNQLELSNRGFSFNRDEPLLMTMDREGSLTAYEVVNTYSEEDLKEILRTYGEEKFAGKIAKAIVLSRKQKRIETSGELKDLVEKSVPKFYERGRIHPATRTFQAVRIQVNRELQELESCLHDVIELLNSGGRIVIISFHSLEDRLVKRFFRRMERGDDLPSRLPVRDHELNRRLKIIGKPVR